jgi:outer membrane protein OmpA-like peptidoglycan-associated protein
MSGADRNFNQADYAAASFVGMKGSQRDPVRFGIINVPANEKVQIGYLLKVGTGVRQGTAINKAQAYVPDTNIKLSNLATAKVIVLEESALDSSTLIGKVFHDRDGDGYQDSASVSDIMIRSGKWSKALGNLKGRVSVLDDPAKYSKTIRVPHTGASQIKVSTKEGTVISIDSRGQITETHQGQKAKGLTAQNLQVETRRVGNATDVIITNFGINEEGIPGVRIASVKGLLIETDGYGRYHMPDAISGRRGLGKNLILKVDTATLPEGAKFTTENPRVLRLTGAALNKINFGVKLPVQAAPERFVKTAAKYEVRTHKSTVSRQVPVYKSVDVTLGSIFFDKDKHNIRADQRGNMELLATRIKRYGKGHITIDAYTDSRHNAKYNIALAERRANTVREELQKRLGSSLMRHVKVDVDKRAYTEVPHNDPRAIDFDKTFAQ